MILNCRSVCSFNECPRHCVFVHCDTLFMAREEKKEENCDWLFPRTVESQCSVPWVGRVSPGKHHLSSPFSMLRGQKTSFNNGLLFRTADISLSQERKVLSWQGFRLIRESSADLAVLFSHCEMARESGWMESRKWCWGAEIPATLSILITGVRREKVTRKCRSCFFCFVAAW